MKILTVSTYDIRPGAARSAYRMHKVLGEYGIDVQMLVQNKSSDDFTVMDNDNILKKIIGLARPKIDQIPVQLYKKKSKTLFSPDWTPFNDIVHKINEVKADIVHFHWVSGGMIPLSQLSKIQAPIVWTLHDMWPFTGGCHYTEGCENFYLKCGKCKVLGSNKERDLSRYSFNVKKNAYGKVRQMTAIGLSKWITEEAKNSSLFKGVNIFHIPNFIDSEFFKPINKSVARNVFNLPQNKKLVLFGAVNPNGDKRKGYSQLIGALEKLNGVNDIELVIFGNTGSDDAPKLDYPAHYTGFLKDEVSVMMLYNACDVIVVPSLQENLSDVIMAGQSCGVPVVCFMIGGNVDMVIHKQTGYLAKAFDQEEMAKGIAWTIEHTKELGDNARKFIVNNFDKEVIIPQYISLYNKIFKPNNT